METVKVSNTDVRADEPLSLTVRATQLEQQKWGYTTMIEAFRFSPAFKSEPVAIADLARLSEPTHVWWPALKGKDSLAREGERSVRGGSPPSTEAGEELLLIYERACEWAQNERHSFVTVDHLLFALVSQQSASPVLTLAGITSMTELDDELVALVHRSPAAPLLSGHRPVVDNAVLALFHHAQGHARRNGRDVCETTDLLAALLDALKSGQALTPGMLALQKRWPQADRGTPLGELLEKLREGQIAQDELMTGIISRDTSNTLQQLAQMQEAQAAQARSIASAIADKLEPLSEKLSRIAEKSDASQRTTSKRTSFLAWAAAALVFTCVGLTTWSQVS